MENDKKLFICFILFIVLCIIAVLSFLGLFFGSEDPYLQHFGVDSSERLYILNKTDISVYEDGVLHNTIDLHASLNEIQNKVNLKAPSFKITSDDYIVVATGEYLCTLDLQGNLLNYGKDANNTQVKLSMIEQVTIPNGDQYCRENTLGRTAIVKNGSEVVYQITVSSLLVKLGLYLSAIMLIGIVITAIRLGITYWREA